MPCFGFLSERRRVRFGFLRQFVFPIGEFFDLPHKFPKVRFRHKTTSLASGDGFIARATQNISNQLTARNATIGELSDASAMQSPLGFHLLSNPSNRAQIHSRRTAFAFELKDFLSGFQNSFAFFVVFSNSRKFQGNTARCLAVPFLEHLEKPTKGGFDLRRPQISAVRAFRRAFSGLQKIQELRIGLESAQRGADRKPLSLRQI